MKLLSIKISLVIAALFVSVSASYALPTCPNSPAIGSNVKGRWDNCVGTYTFANFNQYVGEFKDGQYNGQGTLTYANGDKYVGEFKYGKKNGQGTLTFASGAKYVGEYKDDKRNGQGTITWADGDKYVGEFKDGKRNGYGYFFDGANDKYKGDKFFGVFENGEQKAGLYLNKNGSTEFYETFVFGNTLDFRPHNVLPKLTQVFNSLERDTRKAIQYILKEEGMYNSTIDGAWGKNTLSAVAEFSVLKLKTIEFNDTENVIQIFAAILEYGLGNEEGEPFVSKPTPRNNVDPNKTFNVASGSGFYVSVRRAHHN